MTKKRIVQRITEETQLDQVIVRDVVQRCLDTIIDIATTGGRLELRNFGVFQVKRRAARKARNPQQVPITTQRTGAVSILRIWRLISLEGTTRTSSGFRWKHSGQRRGSPDRPRRL